MECVEGPELRSSEFCYVLHPEKEP